MAKTPQNLIEQGGRIPSLPEVFVKLDEAIGNPLCSISDISDILSEDTSLSSRLLRIANSAFYNFPARIDTITRAMTVVGTKQLRDLVLATSVMKLFKDIPPEMMDMERFWRHSIAVGVSARVIATYMRETNIEHFYVAGLLHDIGRLIIFTAASKQAAVIMQRAQSDDRLLSVIERDVLGFTHADVGGELLKHWKLPATLRECIGYHHKPSVASHYPNEATILHLADILGHTLELGSSGERFVPPVDMKAWEKLGLEVNVFKVILPQIEQQYHDAIEIFLQE